MAQIRLRVLARSKSRNDCALLALIPTEALTPSSGFLKIHY